jgi:dTDP-4-dehydrorhamnose reductase
VWSLLGAFDWNSMLTRQDGYYESGAFDVSCDVPRETLVAQYVRSLTGVEHRIFPACNGEGWWRAPSRVEFHLCDTQSDREEEELPTKS